MERKIQSFVMILFIWLTLYCGGQNPIVTDQFTADPSARVFGDKVYVFPSHDFLCNEEKGRPGWFCMEDYHVFSSSNLTEWTDEGQIVDQEHVLWANKKTYSMWAPDCISRNSRYYFYFPTMVQDTVKYSRGFRIGVAVAKHPEGPYEIQPEPIKNVKGIDPNVFIDKDGQAYLYWSAGNIFVAKLAENMLELASEPEVIPDLPEKGLKEGPYMFERNGIYYLTYPHVENKTERLEYAIGNNPMGPFTVTGVLMDEITGCWTNHHSVIEFKNQWYLFYHHNDLSPDFDKNRSIRIDSLSFNADGTIQKVIPTLRGVGVTSARSKIQVDRYSATSKEGISIEFIDPSDTFKGWKAVFNQENAWLQYNSVDFGQEKLDKVTLKVFSVEGGILEIHTKNTEGPLIAKVNIPKGTDFKDLDAKLSSYQMGLQNLFFVSKGDENIEIDWVSFD